MDEKRIADYFVLSGISGESGVTFDESLSQERLSVPKSVQTPSAPITDITVIIRSAGEVVPNGYTCIELTPMGFPADLNHGSLRSPSLFICYKRGRDKPPLVDIGVLYEGKERVMADSEIVENTFYGKPANVNNSGSRTFLTFRRARDNAPCNQLVVKDICVILANKGESPPHAFCLINKNLNKGMVGSDVFICYKKSMNRPPLLCYRPSIISRFPLDDYPHYSLPESVSLFCFPMGATIECWPKRAQQPKPIFSTFVLTSDSAEKVYGAAVTFYELLVDHRLSDKELSHLTYGTEEDRLTKSLHRIKSISILSRWPFFDTFERFLLFLYKTFVTSAATPQKIPLERYISNFMLEIPFPLPNRPKILVQLGANADETVLISQPPEYMPLALTGASFTQMLRNLGPENCLHVLLFALTEQKLLLHSLRPDVLTSVAEAVVTMIFPFHWQCPYIPMCPIGLSDVLNAPLPFIVGVDSRYFDHFEPPIDVASVDLDTNSIYLSESKRLFNPKIMPKKPTRVLKQTLEKLFERLVRPIPAANGAYGSAQKSRTNLFNDNIRLKKMERKLEFEIQEAFIRFMATILRNFRSYLLPITRAPTVGATDPTSLFDMQGFLKSRDKNYHKFYSSIMKTQMFTRFIEERSFVSDKNISLAFFDECSEKLESMGDSVDSNSLRLLDFGDYIHSDQTVFIPPPEPISADDEYTYQEFGPLDPLLFHKMPTFPTLSRIGSLINESEVGLSENSSIIGPSSPMSKRTKQEIRSAQKIARRHADSPMTWSKCLLSYCYSLWFHHLPAYVKASAAFKPKPLSIAFDVLLRMQSLGFHPSDEVCYRVMIDQTVFIPPPEPISADDEYTYQEFGPLDPLLFHKMPTFPTLSRIGSLINESEVGLSENSSIIGPSSPMSKRTKQEIRSAQKIARRHADSPMTWSKCLLSYCYSLWFHHLPAYVKASAAFKPKPLSIAFDVLLRMQSLGFHPSDEVCYPSAAFKPKPLSIAFDVLLRMQSLGFHPSDEVCYRVMMLLCGIYSEPVLAVKVLFEMKAQKITPNAITYGYYNKAVLESKWPTGDTNGQLMWNKLRNVIVGVAQFRQNTRIRATKLSQSSAEGVVEGVVESETKTNSIKSSSDYGYVTNTESITSEQIPAVNEIVRDFKESDAFRERTRSIVRKSGSKLNCLHDFDSAAGVLMTTDLSKFCNGIDCDESFLRRRHKSAEYDIKDGNRELDTNVISLNSNSPKPYLRSYSFGNDEKIVQKLRLDALRGLTSKLQQNSGDFKRPLTVEKDSDVHKRIPSAGNTFRKVGALSRCTEDPEEEGVDEIDGEVEVMKNWRHNLSQSLIPESKEVCDEKTDQTVRESSVTSSDSKLTNKSSETIDSNKSSEKSADSSKSGVNTNKEGLSSFTPIKEALMNMELFSPEGKVASTLRSSFRIASRFAKSSPSNKTTISRSSTFHETNHSSSEKTLNKIGAFFRRDLQKTESDSATQLKGLTRSSTLPPVSPSKLTDSKTDFETKFEKTKTSDVIESKESISTESLDDLGTEDDNSRENSLLNLSSQWTNRLAANKHSEYVYSTIKSAANNMANRFSGLKSSLAYSGSSTTSSPSKLMNTSNTSGVVTGVATGTANLLSQWASQLAEKFPSNFVFDDDDCDSNNSFDMRRNSFASEDDMSERSREGSLSRHFTGFGSNSSTSPLFELLEKHYSTSLEPNVPTVPIVMEVVMTSCSRCYTCFALIYDEEIMEGWTPDDSNLNTNCSFCSSKFVPLLTIIIKDLRDEANEEIIDPKESDLNESSEQVIDSSNSEQSIPQTISQNEKQFSKSKSSSSLEPITVPYLSPLVLRKEVENVLSNEGDLCLAKPEFVDEHPIIYWNLIWYFKRVNLPSHLHGLCLYANTFNKNKTQNIENFKLNDYQKVSVRCMWDNEKLHEDIGSSPLHRLWLESSLGSPLVHALVTDERKLTREKHC
ncbi:unnamed protein product [Oppiella nova]|uniref:C-myc promoter-binding protein n=1 Tax=Oppiella nova TaxID=334625 RepID=A0A7R9LGJ6_9ACAR|nr:unnamed protein product [Oppiella nova]CAG2163408.1 unnamed protein product [Oppiella nova]